VESLDLIDLLPSVLIGALLCGVAGAVMLGDTGFLLGFFLGPIGLVIAWTLRDSRKEKAAAAASVRQERECPFCAERILVKAKTCKHCGRDVSPTSVGEQPSLRQAAASEVRPDNWLASVPRRPRRFK
jgi:ribosomal protein L37AE/L43A